MDLETQRNMPNSWTVKDVEESDPTLGSIDDDSVIMEISPDQQIFVSETVDDNGHPFLVFSYTEGSGCHGSYDYDMIAKKQRDDLNIMNPKKWKGLTDDERDRLGIDLKDSEVEQMATQESVDDVEEDEKTVVTNDIKPTPIKRRASSDVGLEDKRLAKVKRE